MDHFNVSMDDPLLKEFFHRVEHPTTEIIPKPIPLHLTLIRNRVSTARLEKESLEKYGIPIQVDSSLRSFRDLNNPFLSQFYDHHIKELYDARNFIFHKLYPQHSQPPSIQDPSGTLFLEHLAASSGSREGLFSTVWSAAASVAEFPTILRIFFFLRVNRRFGYVYREDHGYTLLEMTKSPEDNRHIYITPPRNLPPHPKPQSVIEYSMPANVRSPFQEISGLPIIQAQPDGTCYLAKLPSQHTTWKRLSTGASKDDKRTALADTTKDVSLMLKLSTESNETAILLVAVLLDCAKIVGLGQKEALEAMSSSISIQVVQPLAEKIFKTADASHATQLEWEKPFPIQMKHIPWIRIDEYVGGIHNPYSLFCLMQEFKAQ